MKTCVIATLLALLGTATSLVAQAVGGEETLVHRHDGTNDGDLAGTGVAGLGDVDGDGYGDYAFGKLRGPGSAEVYFGFTGSLLVTFQGGYTLGQLGQALAAAGDANGDGVPDLLVADPWAQPGGLGAAGEVFLYSGATWQVLHHFSGPAALMNFGSSVAGVGDVDGDGRDDVLIGAPAADPSGLTDAGAAYLYSGSTGALLASFDGQMDNDHFGGTVAGLGDVDGDSVPDNAVGAPAGQLQPWQNKGIVYVYSGATHTLIRQHVGTDVGESFGHGICTAGDVDGDGVTDYAIGAPYARVPSHGYYNYGLVYFYSGATGNLLAAVNAPTINGTPMVNGSFGAALAGGEDVDGDGALDVVVGAPNGDPSLIGDEGGAFLISGRTLLIEHVCSGSNNSEYLGSAVALCPDLNGDGRADIIAGAPSRDTGAYNGGGVDVFAFDPFLTTDHGRLSAAAGGAVLYSMDFPAADAGLAYALLGSVTGTGPTTLAGVDVPLTSGDWFWNLMFSGHAPPFFSAPYGVLDANGDASCTFTVPPGAGSAYVGTTFFLAAVSYAPPASPVHSSVVVALAVEP